MLSTVLWTVCGLFALGTAGAPNNKERVKYFMLAIMAGFAANITGGM